MRSDSSAVSIHSEEGRGRCRCCCPHASRVSSWDSRPQCLARYPGTKTDRTELGAHPFGLPCWGRCPIPFSRRGIRARPYPSAAN